jgi:hypothetical protein
MPYFKDLLNGILIPLSISIVDMADGLNEVLVGEELCKDTDIGG